MFRRVTALIMVVVTVTMNVEVGFGLARDGDVHHESETQAVRHAQARVGPVVDHGHEDRYDPEFVHGHAASDHPTPESTKARDHGESHEHGTCVDHCTHVHAPALPGHPPAPAPTRLISVRPFVSAELPYEDSHDAPFHPPRA